MVGAALARHWNFPEPIRQSIADHHDADRPGLDALVMVVCAADALAHALDLEGAENAMLTPTAQGAWDRLELREKQIRTVAVQANQEFALACSILQ
jgi:HD-like signal output (HDOD) protein